MIRPEDVRNWVSAVELRRDSEGVDVVVCANDASESKDASTTTGLCCCKIEEAAATSLSRESIRNKRFAFVDSLALSLPERSFFSSSSLLAKSLFSSSSF